MGEMTELQYEQEIIARTMRISVSSVLDALRGLMKDIEEDGYGTGEYVTSTVLNGLNEIEKSLEEGITIALQEHTRLSTILNFKHMANED